MNIVPVSVSVVTQAVEKVLRDTISTGNIERSGEINADPSRCPWVGVYRSDCQFPSRTLGFGSGYRGQRVGVIILAQESDPVSGDRCEDRLNVLVDQIISSLLSEPTLGGAVNTIDEFTVRYPDYQKVGNDQYVQTAMILFTAITTVGGI